MQILVAVKWVPVPESVAFDPVLNRINRQDVAGIVNPLDWGAIEAALTLRGESGGRVIAVTWVPRTREPPLKRLSQRAPTRASTFVTRRSPARTPWPPAAQVAAIAKAAAHHVIS